MEEKGQERGSWTGKRRTRGCRKRQLDRKKKKYCNESTVPEKRQNV
jgi:hypothetical protein